MKTIIVKTHKASDITNEQSVVTQDGVATVIQAVDDTNYEFLDVSIGHGPNHIISKRVDTDLHISFEREGEDSDLIIENFYDEDGKAVNSSALVGIAEDGQYYYYIPDTGEVYDFVTQLKDGVVEGQALGGEDYATPWWLAALPLVGLTGLVPLLLKDDDDDSPAPNSIELTAPTVVITEDTDNDGVITNDELDGTVGVSITVPDNARPGDTLVITGSDGTIEELAITNDIIADGVTREYPAPSDGQTIVVEAVIKNTDGKQSPTSSDTALIDTTPPVVDINAPDDEAVEGIDDTLVFMLSQDNLSTFDTTVQVKVGESSTVLAADIATISYTNAAGEAIILTEPADIQNFLDNGDSLTIPAGSKAASPITVTVIDDDVYERSESLVLEIDTAQNASVGIDSATGMVRDEDDETLPTLSIDDVTMNEQDGTMTFTISVEGTTSQDISVSYTTSGVRAVSPVDYTAQSDILTIPAGTTSTTVTVPITNDEVWEPTETFKVTLSNAVNATIADDTGIGTIINDDITAIDDTASAVEGGGADNTEGSNTASGNVLSNDIPSAANASVTSISDGVNEGTLGSKLVGKYGALILNADGSFTYEVDDTKPAVQQLNEGDTLTESFHYTMSDGTLSDTALLNITINGNNDTLVDLAATSVRVSEEGLADGITDNIGDTDTTDSPTASGTITFTDIDTSSAADDIDFELTGPSDIKVQGNEVTWSWDNATDILTGQAIIEGDTPTEVMTIKVNTVTADGSDYTATYDTTLLHAIDHPINSAENNLALQFEATVNEVNEDHEVNNTSTTSFTVTVEDDRPVVAEKTVEIPLGPVNTNVMVLLDSSGSMNNDAGIDNLGTTRFDVAKVAINNLIDGFSEVGNLRIQILETVADSVGQDTWLTPEEAKIYIEKLTLTNGTNYDGLLNSAIDAFAKPGALTDAQNYAYMLSDGVPTFGLGKDNTLTGELNGDGNTGGVESGDEGIQAAEEAIWTDFLTENKIKSYAFAMGSEVTTNELMPISYDGQLAADNDNELALVVTEFDQLNDVLLSALPEYAGTGNLVSGDVLNSQTGYGADGGHITSITVDDTVYKYHQTNNSISTIGEDRSSFEAATTTISIDTVAGGVMMLNFETGQYNYQSTATIKGYQETISFTVIDNDGDTSSAEQTFNIYHLNPMADHIITNESSPSIDIDQAVLLANDNLATTTTVSEGSSADGGTVSGNDPFVFEFDANSSSQGSFEYALSDGIRSETTNVNIIVEDSNVLPGTILADTLIGRAGENDTLEGLSGNDVLQGRSGNDSLNGGDGNDTFIWTADDKGVIGSPDTDTISDFASGNNLLHLHDLLQGETIGNVESMENYVSWEANTSTLHISSTGGYANGYADTQTDLNIVLNGYSGDVNALIDNYII